MLRKFASVSAVLLLAGLPAIAQSTYGTILGTVKDPSGAVVPNTHVSVTEVETNISKSATTNNLGDYEIPNLLPGSYDVSVEVLGFKKFARRGVLLDPRATVRADATLEVGEARTAVEVISAPPVVTTETATVSDAQRNREIEQLPINFRAVDPSPLQVVINLPGVQEDPSGRLMVSGSRQSQNEVSLDGFSVTGFFNGPAQRYLPSTEAVSEVKVVSGLGDAEYGQVGDISFVGKGGSNDFHGSLFEYLQNSSLDAIPLFATRVPPKVANDFGGSIGGPVIIPHHYNGRNRTFFFFDWESNRFNTSQVITDSVPTAAMRKGDFSALCASFDSKGICTDPKGTQLTNPFNGQPFPSNNISSLINPVSQKITDTFFPLPNHPNPNPGDVSANFRTTGRSPRRTNLFDIRMDQNLTSKQSIFGRFSWKHFTRTNALDLLQGVDLFSADPKSVGLSYNYSIRPNVFNEFRFGFEKEPSLDTFPSFPDGAKAISDLGLQGLGPFPKGSGFPEFDFDQSPITGIDGDRDMLLVQKRYQFADNLTWIRGRHTIKFGTDVRQNQAFNTVSFFGADQFGIFEFDGSFTGFDFADLLLGLPLTTKGGTPGPDLQAAQRAYAFYGQDQFKVTPKLTVTYGLRYEYHAPFHEDLSNLTNFNRVDGSVIVPNEASLKLTAPGFPLSVNACPGIPGATTPCTKILTARQAGLPETLRISDKKKILPRLGFAYRLNSKTVIRGGAGIYDETLLGSPLFSIAGIHSADIREFPNAIVGGKALIQFPNTKLPGIGSVAGIGTQDFRTANQIDLHDPYASQWNLTVERDLGWNTGLRVSYKGMRSVGLLVSPDLNQPRPHPGPFDRSLLKYPNWNIIFTRDNGGSAFFGGLETTLTHRVGSGVYLQSTYSLSKNLSDADGTAPNGGFAGENGPRLLNPFNKHGDYGNASFTRRHRWLTTYVVDLPVGRGKKWGNSISPLWDYVVGHWQTSGILLLQTGPFLTPLFTGGTDPSGTNANRRGAQRPDRVCAGTVPRPTVDKFFDRSCFVVPATGIGRFGNSGVGILEGPGTVNWSAGFAKIFPIKERVRLRFETTATNILNHANPDRPQLNVRRSSFGQIRSVQAVEGTGARTFQFSLRVEF